ncbi:DNA methyltransferase [Vagococcus vulneris]|uniref:Type III restriction endonuclease subunit M n=1 Tax=Vagococcus vulneris TaxID=1977869 RepID=A0A430A1E7_9ENTE|nr:site-specific DNA-methyltransferase [Vagococcus vulneris]RSU00231.1 hypothetical protein CBF37_02740 [Vagococcus vulneris]
MAETVLLTEIRQVLSQFPEYWDNEILLKNRVSEDLRSYEPKLITALLSKDKIKEQFEITINGTSIFKIEEFIQLFTYKDFWEDSYTKYSNKIGLTANGKYLDYNSDVVLDFPFKDCVLEGGMTKEVVGKKEVYYNKVIARDEVDTLLAPKVFTNTKKYNADNEESVLEITNTDNLVIQGNNLLALHSLKEKYAGKVKCIYIDPPYNTGGDSFKYNDRFNHSTWLTFMKNRLEIARDLLSEDGSIWINIDDDEQAYLKVLSDSVFGRTNFISNFIWEKKYAPQNSAKYVSDMHDHILLYAKNIEKLDINGLPRSQEMNARYKNLDNDERGIWQSDNLLRKDVQKSGVYEIITPVGREVLPPSGTSWRVSKSRYKELLADNRIWFGSDGKGVPRLKRFLHEVSSSVVAGTIWGYTEVSHNQEAKRELLSLFNESPFGTPKPEKLLQRIIHIASNENDLVLDFFMGSATTQAVAMKMNRQFIGIEQMDYIKSVSVPRLQKVMEGEQGGISKNVNWHGGGSFIYTELMDLNNQFVKQIQEAKTSSELLELLETIKKYADLNYLVELEKLTNEPIVIDEDTKETLSFEELSLDKQKELLIDVMDINQLYVNYSEIDDDMYHVSEQDKAFNRSFYGVGDN